MMPKRSRESSTPTPRSSRKVKTKADSSQEGEGETQNSGSTWWSAKCILEERKGQYKIAWEGINPDTRQPWAPTWEPKSNASKSLVETWRRKLAGESGESSKAKTSSRRFPSTRSSLPDESEDERGSRGGRKDLSSSEGEDAELRSKAKKRRIAVFEEDDSADAKAKKRSRQIERGSRDDGEPEQKGQLKEKKRRGVMNNSGSHEKDEDVRDQSIPLLSDQEGTRPRGRTSKATSQEPVPAADTELPAATQATTHISETREENGLFSSREEADQSLQPGQPDLPNNSNSQSSKELSSIVPDSQSPNLLLPSHDQSKGDSQSQSQLHSEPPSKTGEAQEEGSAHPESRKNLKELKPLPDPTPLFASINPSPPDVQNQTSSIISFRANASSNLNGDHSAEPPQLPMSTQDTIINDFSSPPPLPAAEKAKKSMFTGFLPWKGGKQREKANSFAPQQLMVGIMEVQEMNPSSEDVTGNRGKRPRDDEEMADAESNKRPKSALDEIIPDSQLSQNTLRIEELTNENLSLNAKVEALSLEIAQHLSSNADLQKKVASLEKERNMAREDVEYRTMMYQQASNAATARAAEAQAAEREVARLKDLLETGMKQRDLFEQAKERKKEDEIKRLQRQLDLMREQARLTDDEVRSKAAKWDAEEERLQYTVSEEEDEEEEEAEVFFCEWRDEVNGQCKSLSFDRAVLAQHVLEYHLGVEAGDIGRAQRSVFHSSPPAAGDGQMANVAASNQSLQESV